jgi:sugar lactone lactonase YvrE
VNSATGLLYRVDPETGQATEVDLGGNSLPNGDGLLVRGRTLYVVQNQDNQVAVFRLNAAGTAGQLVDTLTSDDFDIPTTVAAFGNSLYLPNARFNTPPTPDTPYWITRIDRRS